MLSYIKLLPRRLELDHSRNGKEKETEGKAFVTREQVIISFTGDELMLKLQLQWYVQPLDMETPSHAGDTEGAPAIPILLGITDIFYIIGVPHSVLASWCKNNNNNSSINKGPTSH
jgi:hypothetical protein